MDWQWAMGQFLESGADYRDGVCCVPPSHDCSLPSHRSRTDGCTMIIGPAAIRHCGMLQEHAAIFTEVASAHNAVLASRELNPLCEGLLREGHASKGFHIKAKSCDWGPMAGMVLVNPRHSKERNLAKQQGYIDKALEHGAGQQQVFVSSQRLMELSTLGLINQRKNGVTATEIEISASSRSGASGEFIARRVGNQEPIWQLFEIVAGQETPVLGLTNVQVASAGPQPSGAHGVVAGDYDLFCVWGRHHNRRVLGSAPRALHGQVAKKYINAVRAANNTGGNEDPDMGNVSFYATIIIKKLNEGIVAKCGYRGGNMIHHNDESGNPFTPGEDYPLLFFIPGQSPRAICNAHELSAIYSECERLGYAVERNPGFTVRTKPLSRTEMQKLLRMQPLRA